MNIQKINYRNNINFTKNESKARKPHILNCNVGEYSDGKKNVINFSIEKENLFSFLKNLFKDMISLNKDDEVAIQINMNIKENNKPKALPSAQTKPSIKPQVQPFPTPKFKSNPTVEQRDEYIKELLKFLNNKIGTQDKLKAFDEIKRYGISDIDLINFGLYDPDEKVIRKTLEIYQQYGSDKNVYQIIGLIRKDVVDIKEEQTFVELLKTIQKLANIKDDTLQEQRIITEPIKRLSNCENENVRKMAQETLDKITSKE